MFSGCKVASVFENIENCEHEKINRRVRQYENIVEYKRHDDSSFVGIALLLAIGTSVVWKQWKHCQTLQTLVSITYAHTHNACTIDDFLA